MLLDNELPESEAEVIHQHCGECASCTHLCSEYRALRTAITAAPTSETADLTALIEARIGVDGLNGLLLTEIRLLRDQVQLLSGEVAELRRELAPSVRSTPRFSIAPENARKHYRLV